MNFKPRCRIGGLGWIIAAGCLFPTSIGAGELSQADLNFFEAKIRPVLIEHCYECHSSKSELLQGGLRVDSRPAIRAGGDSGPGVVPGDVDASLLLDALRHESFEMPPAGKLPDSVIDDFATWITRGAPDPREGDAAPVRTGIDWQAARQFWSFQPIRDSSPPPISNASWPQSDIDRFILARIESAGLSPAADADPHVLVRRLYFDLIGLPPEPEEIAAFVSAYNDDRPSAVEALVDRLLQSPHFGERWGRHWLDVVRYADSTGGGRSRVLHDAWRFRNYVFDAFNSDKPFDELIVEHIAGDLMPSASDQQRAERLTATGFLTLGPTNYELQDKELLRMEVIDEQVDTISRVFMGMTVGCARCHDHKFDPIPTADYYAMAGIFRSTKTLTPGNVSGFVVRPLPVPSEQEAAIAEHATLLAAAEKELNGAKAELKAAGGTVAGPAGSVAVNKLPGIVVDHSQAEVVGTWKLSQSVGRYVGNGYLHDENSNDGERRVVFAPEVPETGEYEVRISFAADRNRAAAAPITVRFAGGEKLIRVDQRQTPPIDGLFLSLGKFPFEQGRDGTITIGNDAARGHVIADAVQLLPVAGESLLANAADEPEAKQRLEAKKRLETRVKQLEQKLATLKKQAPPAAPVVMSVQDEDDEIGDYHVCIRGNPRQFGEVVPRGVLRIISDPPQLDISPGQSGRLELARWIASPQHPLTARVYANRVWHHLFGTGIVRTPDNFGATGEMPSHPELLDYLASRFMEEGWSTKQLVRRVVLSRVYQLSTEPAVRGRETRAQQTEPAQRPVDSENRILSHYPLRRLDAESIRDAMLVVSGEIDLTYGGTIVPGNLGSELGYQVRSTRRSVYVPAFRNAPEGLFDVFDFANPNLVTGARNTSTLPTQALYMMNSPFVMDCARQAAQRLLGAEELTDDQRIELAYQRALGRLPTAAEFALARRFLEADSSPEGQHPTERLDAWSEFCQTLFACLDFRYVK